MYGLLEQQLSQKRSDKQSTVVQNNSNKQSMLLSLLISY